jgi:DNA-binding MarR family transcriptional regulator
MSAEVQKAPIDEPGAMASIRRAPDGRIGGLVSMRMVILFTLMRRSTLISQRHLFGLSEIEWRIMTQLDVGISLSLNGLAQVLAQDRGQLSRAVKSMVERGFLTRTRKPGGPEIEIGLAPAGLQLREKMEQRVLERDAFLTHGIDPADIEALRRVIDQMIERADLLLQDAMKQAEEKGQGRH